MVVARAIQSGGDAVQRGHRRGEGQAQVVGELPAVVSGQQPAQVVALPLQDDPSVTQHRFQVAKELGGDQLLRRRRGQRFAQRMEPGMRWSGPNVSRRSRSRMVSSTTTRPVIQDGAQAMDLIFPNPN
jgi:hypothetical protein